MSSWKLVEAEVMRTSDTPDGVAAPSGHSEGGGGAFRDRGPGTAYGTQRGGSYRYGARNSNGRAYRDESGGFRRQGRGNSGGYYQRGGGYNYQGVFIPDTPETRAYNVAVAMQYIDYLFSLDNLCRDTYFRSFMDEEGYVPLALLMQAFPSIAASGAEYFDLLAALTAAAAAEGSRLEVDAQNDTVRLREGWATWLIPNPSGGKGLPRYIKQQQQPSSPSELAASDKKEEKSSGDETTAYGNGRGVAGPDAR